MATKTKKSFDQVQDNIYQQVNDKIIEILQQQKQGNWNKPWFAPTEPFAYNPYSNHKYKTLNQLLLSKIFMFSDFSVNRWLTMKQANNLDAKVKKGSKSAPVYFSSFLVIDTNKTQNRNITRQYMNGTKQEQEEILNKEGVILRYYMKYFRVFNVDQIEGLPEYMTTKPEVKFSKKGEKNETAEQMILNTSFVQVTEKDVNQAFYNPARDLVVIPKNFKSWEGMYETFFHEIAHSTMNETRLNRGNKFKDSKKSYAFEELVAELTSAYICAYCGIEKNITNNAAYINSWLKALQDDKTFIFKASTEAGKAANYILNKTIQPVESVE